MRRVLLYIAVDLIILQIAYSQSNEDKLRRSRETTLKEIEYANQMLLETQGKTKQSLNEISVINHRLNKRKEYLLGVELEMNMLSGVIDQNNDSVAVLEQKIERTKKIYGKVIFNLYRNRTTNYRMMYLLASENMSQLYQRIRMFKILNRYLRNRKAKLIEMMNSLVRKNMELEELRSNKEVLAEKIKIEQAVITKEIREKKKLVTQLTKRQKEIEEQIREKQKTAKKLETELKKVIDEERRRIKTTGAKEFLTPEEKLISSDFEKNYGRLPWPTAHGIITGKYGEHQHPDYKSVTIRNDGIYISTTTGEVARAVFKGVVSRVFTIPGENSTIIIKHGDYYTLYHNLTNVTKKAGQSVNTKDIIGTVFTNATTSETILYFQVWKEKEKRDPELWLAHE